MKLMACTLMMLVFGGCFASRPNNEYLNYIANASPGTPVNIYGRYSDKPDDDTPGYWPDASLYLLIVDPDGELEFDNAGYSTSIELIDANKHLITLYNRDGVELRQEKVDLKFIDGYLHGRRHFKVKVYVLINAVGSDVVTFGIDEEGHLVSVRSSAGTAWLAIIPVFSGDGQVVTKYKKLE